MFNTTRRFRIYMVLMLALLGSVTMVTPVFAAGITVTTVADEDGTGDDCSLREAIKAANTDAAYGGCSAGSGSDTITLPIGTYTLTLGEQLPAVATTVIIDGNESIVQADASPNTATYRVFEVIGGGDLTLNDLTIQHGNCVNGLSCTSQSNPDDDKGRGGGIFNAGILTLSNVTVRDNSADNNGGGLYHKAGTLNLLAGSNFLENIANSDGGGIASGGSGSMTVTNATFRSNQAGNSGGGISSSGSTLDVTGSIFETNSAGGSGGGIIGNGDVHVKTSTFDGNSANRGGGFFNGGGTDSFVANSTFYSNTASSKGGGIYNYEDLAVTNSTFSLNSAAENGGALYSDPYQHENDSIYAVVSLTNTILANSTSGGDCYNYVNGLKVDITGSNNLIETDSTAPNACETTSPINNTDPNLGALTGSPDPQYYPLLPGSPAIDAGDDATCATAPVNNTSQNGVTRPQGLHCDIGAYELAPKTDTTTALASAPNPSVVGELVVFTATVTAGIGTPAGTVTFTEGITLLGSGPLDASGQVTLSTSALAAGEHLITATYSGDANFDGSTSDVVTQTVTATSATTGTTTTLASAPNPSVVGELVVFTATVTAEGGTSAVSVTFAESSATPTGSVTFTDGGATLGTVPLDNGVATFSTSNLSADTHTISAAYSGDANFSASTSAAITQSVTAAGPASNIFLPLVSR